MPLPLLMPVTLVTTAIFCLILVALGIYVILGRFKHTLAHGDQGNVDMVIRMRTQSNFVEYVPLALILLALLESSGADRPVLAFGAAVFVILRIFHIFGMRQSQPALFRRIGAMGSFLILILASIWALTIAAVGLFS